MESKTGRRTFHLSFIYGLWGLITAALSVPAVAYLLFPPKRRQNADFVAAADLTQLALKQPEEVVFRRNNVDGWKISSEKDTAWVVRLSESEVVAFAPQCTHLGCAYHWDERRDHFVCPCHTSAFSIDGRVLTGPAPRALDRYETKVEGGKLLLGPVKKA